MDETIQGFVDGKRIAVLGASRLGKKFGNSAAAELKERGYQVFLVHPEARRMIDFILAHFGVEHIDLREVFSSQVDVQAVIECG